MVSPPAVGPGTVELMFGQADPFPVDSVETDPPPGRRRDDVVTARVAGRASALALALTLTACTPAVPALSAGPGCTVRDGRADITCTPGATNPDVTPDTLTITICQSGWTATVRPPAAVTNALKARQMTEYHQAGSPAGFEEDHLVALETGGAPRDPSNLWPQPRSGTRSAAVKDAEENRVHRDICAGRLTLHDGQARLLADWTHS